VSSYQASSPADQAAAYERYISENWDSLPSYEQEQAKAYMRAKFEASQQPGYQSGHVATPNMYSGQYASAGYGYGQGSWGNTGQFYGGYGPGAFGPPKRDEAGWAVPIGYVGVLFFTPLAIYCGIKNLSNGRSGHGYTQLVLGLLPWLLVMVALATGP
jgi:hypothetical protein